MPDVLKNFELPVCAICLQPKKLEVNEIVCTDCEYKTKWGLI